jgi:phage terminase small subunit
MRVRRPKPTRLKLLTGNPGKRPLNNNEPHPEVAIPDCPLELGPVAKQEWDRMAAQLGPLRMITQLDRAALASYCAAYALGRGDPGHPDLRRDGEIAVRLPGPVAIRLNRQPPNRDHDADRIRVWLYTGR